jgi:gas vesicle protein GvpL/GvpF
MATPTVADGTRVCYLYGIVAAGRSPSLEGIAGVGGAPISIVESGSLAAVVSEIAREDLAPAAGEQEDARWLERAVLAHEHVLEQCLVPGPVLPMRFATTLREDSDVRALLRERAPELSASLERLVGRREWGVKARLGSPEALVQHVRTTRSDLAAAEAELQSRSAGAAYLARKRLDQELTRAGDELIAELVDAAHSRLAAAADDSRLIAGSHARKERIFLNAAYLLAEDAEQNFRQALAELGDEHAEVGLDYELTGPWPAYNFATDEAQQ